MKIVRVSAFVAAIATVFGAVYIHDRAHRYDVVTVAAGSGGSQEQPGETKVDAYLIDHATGRVWTIEGVDALPVTRMTCKEYNGGREADYGCENTGKK
jgi:hypothetical protein